MARSSVLLPDMFDPVMSRNRPGGPSCTSLATRTASASSGWPDASPFDHARRRIDDRERPLRLIECERGQSTGRIDAADGLEPAAHVGAVPPAPALDEPPDVEIPRRQRVQRHEQPRRVPDVGERHELLELAQRRRCGVDLADARQRAAATRIAPRGRVRSRQPMVEGRAPLTPRRRRARAVRGPTTAAPSRAAPSAATMTRSPRR